MCRLRNIAMRDYQESVTTGRTDRQTPDKVIPMCHYASQATKKSAWGCQPPPFKIRKCGTRGTAVESSKPFAVIMHNGVMTRIS